MAPRSSAFGARSAWAERLDTAVKATSTTRVESRRRFGDRRVSTCSMRSMENDVSLVRSEGMREEPQHGHALSPCLTPGDIHTPSDGTGDIPMGHVWLTAAAWLGLALVASVDAEPRLVVG